MELQPVQEEAIAEYEALLRTRGLQMGLVASSDVERLRERHIKDSLRAAALISNAERIADIGSGAGLPGIVLAIALPKARFVLIEPRHRAAAFLELAVDRLGLRNVEVVDRRVEEVDLAADLATARAFGPLQRSWEAACRVLRPGGRLVYFAGAGLEDPEGAARAIVSPEPPASVDVERVVAGASPLVMMTRQG